MVMYLHHQWSDGADTLQFDSTGQYSKTVEYELQRLTELRDIEYKWSDFRSESDYTKLVHRLDPVSDFDKIRPLVFKWTYLEAHVELEDIVSMGI